VICLRSGKGHWYKMFHVVTTLLAVSVSPVLLYMCYNYDVDVQSATAITVVIAQVYSACDPKLHLGL